MIIEVGAGGRVRGSDDDDDVAVIEVFYKHKSA
jgi:hypothetical protein